MKKVELRLQTFSICICLRPSTLFSSSFSTDSTIRIVLTTESTMAASHSPLTTHVLDVSLGKPAKGMEITLHRLKTNSSWELLKGTYVAKKSLFLFFKAKKRNCVQRNKRRWPRAQSSEKGGICTRNLQIDVSNKALLWKNKHTDVLPIRRGRNSNTLLAF